MCDFEMRTLSARLCERLSRVLVPTRGQFCCSEKMVAGIRSGENENFAIHKCLVHLR